MIALRNVSAAVDEGNPKKLDLTLIIKMAAQNDSRSSIESLKSIRIGFWGAGNIAQAMTKGFIRSGTNLLPVTLFHYVCIFYKFRT